MTDMKSAVAKVKSAGRMGDTVLMHVNPVEVEAMHKASPTGLTINPDTGQPEAFLPLLAALGGGWLGSTYLPAAWGAGATALGSGLGATGGSLMQGRDPKDALMAGLLAGGTTATLGAFGDAAVAPNLNADGMGKLGFDKFGMPMDKNLNLYDPGYREAYDVAPASMWDKLSYGVSEEGPGFAEMAKGAFQTPWGAGGAAAAGLGALGGGFDPLMGVPQYDIPEVEDDDNARGPNKHLGKNEVFWPKPPGWTDDDGEWDFYWPQGVTPPQYAAGGGLVVRGYQGGGFVRPTPTPEERRRGIQQNWEFETPILPPLDDEVSAEIEVLDPLGRVTPPLLPSDSNTGGLSEAPTPATPALAPEAQEYSYAYSDPGFVEPGYNRSNYNLPEMAAMGLATAAAPLGVGALVSGAINWGKDTDLIEKAEEEHGKEVAEGLNRGKSAVSLLAPALTIGAQLANRFKDRYFDTQSANAQAKAPLQAARGLPQEVSPGGAGAAAAIAAALGDGDGGSAPQGGVEGYKNAPENFDWAQGGLIRGYQKGGPVAPQPQQLDPIVQGAIAAIRGQHPEPQKAVQVFINTYGQEAFARLRQQVIAQSSQGARQGSGLGQIRGPGDGLSDSVPANIEGQEPVALSDGEVVVPADVVSGLGNGSSEAGAQALEAMNEKVRKQRTGLKNQPRAINPGQAMPSIS